MKINFYLTKSLKKGGKLVFLLGLVFASLSIQAQNLVWEENFDGTTINPDNWMFDFGDGCERGLCGWGNQELEYYTSRPENARIEDGNLLIEARRENFGSKQFTSARLRTYGRVSFKYGTLEARIKVPDLKNGLWPAFWMLGTTGTWPASGEIDILEMGSKASIDSNRINKQVGAAVHWAYQQWQADYDRQFISPTDLTNEYHVYKMVWTNEFIRTFIDDVQFFEFDIRGIDTNSLEEFHRQQYILLNLAVGGQYTGIYGVDGITAPLPGKMYIDYIRLYQNPGDELFLAKDNEIAGNYGIYTEDPQITNRLVYGQDANLYVWNNLANITDPAPVPFEGNEVLAFRAAPGNWFGFGVATTGPKNLQNFSEGSLKFNFKTSFTGQFKIGLSSGFGDSWINFPGGTEAYGLLRDGQWHEVTIPLSAFDQPNMGMHIDLGSISQAFMLAGDAPAANADFYIDNVYFSGGIASNPAPIVAITSPANDSIFNTPASITITADASDTNGSVANVDFYQGTTLLGSDSIAPYSFTWENPAEGVYTITAKATDNEGATKTSQDVRVFVSESGNTAPTVSIVSPINDSTFYTPASINIAAEATDNGSIYKVDFYNGGTLLSSDDTAPFSYLWNVTTAGIYPVVAVATDNGGLNTTSDTVIIVVEEPAKPTVALTSPANNSNFTAPTSVTIEANASTTQGSVTKVEFYADATLLGSDDTAPYTFDWEVVDAGTYSLTAKAYNSFNANQTSEAVAVVVNEIVGPNLALNKPAVSSSDENAGTPASNAVDGNTGTRWSSAFADPQWLYVDLQNTYSINRVKITWEGAMGKDYIVQVSDDATTWSDIKTVTGNSTLINDWKGLSGTGRYVRIYGTARATVYGYSFFELEVYGTEAPQYCGKVENGDYSYLVKTEGENVTFTFHPEAPIAGSNMAIVYIREGATGGYPGYGMTKNDSGDFTYTKAIADGTEVSFYFTYAVPSGGERNSSATPHSYTVGTSCAGSTTSNVAPTISITSPTVSDSFSAPANITISANATDADGSVTKVEFFNGNTLLSSDDSIPFSFEWTNVEAGTYALTAKATDNGGKSTTSEAVTITVTGSSNEGGYCGTVENGDYSYKALTSGADVTITFHPEAPIAGSNMAIVYIRESGDGVYPGYGMTKTSNGDFTYTKSIANGTTISFYFTYAVPSGGERNSSATPHSYTVGTSCIPVNNPDSDGDGFTSDLDCNDNDASIYPGATEVCDGIDNNCDGQIDEGVQSVFYADADGDGFGNKADSALACSAPQGYVAKAGDCNDQNANVYPGATEVCDGIDNNCDGQIDEGVQSVFYADADGDGFGNEADSTLACSAPEGYAAKAGDCNDQNANVYPGAIEVCDGIDNNCDGQIDEGVQSVFYVDADGDGFGNEADSILACSAPQGYVANAGDCNDNDSTINPEGVDLCDGIDRNCDGKVKNPVQAPVIKVTPTSIVYTGGETKTLYLGYGPQSLILYVVPKDSTTYTWSPSEDLMRTKGIINLFSPSAPGIYTISVTATNTENCSASASVTINVIDARCDKNKVMVCHKGRTICISPFAVKDHLAHGDQLGECSSNEDGNSTPELSVFPNPTSNDLYIQTDLDLTKAKIKVFNSFGFEMRNVHQEGKNKLDVSCLPSGTYLLVVTKGKDQVYTHFIKH